MKKCIKCGYEGESKFCPECGAEMQEIVIEKPEEEAVEIVETKVDSAAKESKAKNKKPISAKHIAIFAGIIVVAAIVIYLCIPMGRATFNSEAEMQEYFCGIFEHSENGELKHRLIIREDSFDVVYIMPVGSNKSIDNIRIDAWNYRRGYIDNHLHKMITNKDGSIKYDGDIYAYAGKLIDGIEDIEGVEDLLDKYSNSNSDSKETATTGEKNALKSAKDYLSGSSGFSEQSLRRQLDYEGYTESEVDYAIENCNADWKAQCKKSAESYLNGSSSFSKEGLINQLEYEGFDHDMVVEVVDEVY